MEMSQSNSLGTILVVEDEAVLRMIAVDLLTGAGFEVIQATTADEAIAILDKIPDIRLVFSDVDMPGTMDGIKLVHHIRDRWPPVLLLVASGKHILAESQLPSGTKFFRKPYRGDTIVSTVKSMLGVDSLPSGH